MLLCLRITGGLLKQRLIGLYLSSLQEIQAECLSEVREFAFITNPLGDTAAAIWDLQSENSLKAVYLPYILAFS
jgi:hypothetical protein